MADRAAKVDADVDYYALLGITLESSTKDIANAYRRKALKVHPDKNPDDPKAAALFHELSKAYEVLTDPAAKEAYDRLQRAKLERRKRHEQLDTKRRKLKDDLLEREQAAREQRRREDEARREAEQQLRRLREEGLSRQLKEEEARARALFEQATREATPEPAVTPILEQVSELDKTLKIRWDPAKQTWTSASLSDVLSAFGPVSSVVVSAKKPGSAVAAFESIVAAHAAMSAPQTHSLQLSWAGGSEPAILGQLPDLIRAAAINQARTAVHAAARAAVEAGAVDADALPDVLERAEGRTHEPEPGVTAGIALDGARSTPPPLGHPTASAQAAGIGAATVRPPTASPFAAYGASAASLFPAFTGTAAWDQAAATASRDYENLTLMRMRQAQERQRLIAELQKRDSDA